MKETKELLMEDYKKVSDLLTVVQPDDEKYGRLIEERDDIRNELIKMDSIEIDANGKKAEIEAEDRREKVRNYITIGTFVGTSLISIWAVLKTFKFDEDGTVTSTLGRGILSGIIPKFKQK